MHLPGQQYRAGDLYAEPTLRGNFRTNREFVPATGAPQPRRIVIDVAFVCVPVAPVGPTSRTSIFDATPAPGGRGLFNAHANVRDAGASGQDDHRIQVKFLNLWSDRNQL